MTSAIRARREAEDGFTLIELLVVVIIIGILAAIAIPAFLNQRERAWQAQLTSAVRNAALDVEAEATASGGSYPADADGETVVDGFQDDTLHEYLVDGTNTDFCIIGTHNNIGATAAHIDYQASTGGMNAFSETDPATNTNTACTLD